jgi:serine/threonine protein kinase/Tfp pilus assembly protein PilF
MGIVYEAYQRALNRKVALKVLPAILSTASPDAVARFRREATAAAKLHHTNIIPIYDFGEARDGHYYAMELIEGTSLDKVVRRLATENISATSATRLAELLQTRGSPGQAPAGRSERPDSPPASPVPAPPPAREVESSSGSGGRGRMYFRQITRWIADVADALDCAHKQGIIHRDIKPSNLILSRDGRVMVGDFGLARGVEDRSVTMTGSLVGTLRYMSPEQAMAKRVRVDHRTDIYSLGATVYELLTFRPAFPGDDDKEVLGAIISREPTAPRKLNPDVPRELETICLKMLEKSPDARYESARALADDLRRYTHDLPIVAKRPGLFERAVKFVKRHKGPVVAACTCVLLIATAAMLVRTTRQRLAERREAQVQRLLDAAKLHATGEEWDDAEATLRDALELEPHNVGVLLELARIKKVHFNAVAGAPDVAILEQAAELCRKALELEPERVLGLNLHGVLLKMLGRYDDAMAAYTEVARLRPDWYAGWVNLGTIQALTGELEAATASLERATELAALDDPYAVDTWRNLASLQLYRGRTDAAAANIDKAIQCNREDMASWLIRARLELALGLEAASESVGTANYLAEGREPKVMRIAALANLRSGRYDKAITSASQAVDLGDSAAINHLAVAIAKARRDEPDAARAHLGQALSAWPDELRNEGDFLATADKGILWFETAAELSSLRDQADELLGEH